MSFREYSESYIDQINYLQQNNTVKSPINLEIIIMLIISSCLVRSGLFVVIHQERTQIQLSDDNAILNQAHYFVSMFISAIQRVFFC